MMTLNRTIAMTLLATSFALPTVALAESHAADPMKLTCAEFSAMDMEGMMAAVDAMHKASPDAAMAMDEEAMKMANEMTMKGCDGKPDMMAMEAMMMK
jgi:hypothetical protein